VKTTAYWCLLTIRWTAEGDAGFITFEGEMFIGRRGTTRREAYQQMRAKALEAAPDGAKCAVVCWVLEPMVLRKRRWWQRADPVPIDFEIMF
jgi:hypothetical protein